MKNRSKAWRFLAILMLLGANLTFAGMNAQQARAESNAESCVSGPEPCRCFSSSYCQDGWPSGDTCDSSNDCD